MTEMMDVIYSLSDNPLEKVVTPRALTCSQDNQYLLCCRDAIFHLSISCNLDTKCHTNSRALPCQVTSKKIFDLAKARKYNIPKGILNVMDSLKQMSREERALFLTDSSLYSETFKPTSDSTGFYHAVFSPFSSVIHGCLVAAVTSDHRAFVFCKKSEEWILVCDLTKQIKSLTVASKDIPLTIGAKGISFNEYTELIHSMCCVDIVWSTPFRKMVVDTDTESTVSDVHIFLLFCGMRNGDVQIWKLTMSFECQLDSDLFNQIAVNSNASEVTSLFWHFSTADKGYLAIGLMDGCVRILSITHDSSGDFEIKENYKHNPQDHIAINDLSSTQLTPNISIIVACKQHLINVFSIQEGITNIVKSIYMDCSLPLETISIQGRVGCASGQDGALHYFMFEIDEEDENVNVQTTMATVTCLPNRTSINWATKGVALSPNGALCLSLHTPASDHGIPGQIVNIHFMRQRIVLSLMPFFTKDDYILSSNSLETLRPLPLSQTDVMLRLLWLIHVNFKSKVKSFELTDEVVGNLISSNCLKNLQVAHGIYMYHFKRHQMMSAIFSGNWKAITEADIQELKEKILIRYIANSFHTAATMAVNSPGGNDSDKKFGLDPACLSYMYMWASRKEKRMNALKDYLKNENILVQIEKAASSTEMHNCGICGADLITFHNQFEVECLNRHTSHLCCLTFIPLDGSETRRCSSCNASAMTINQIEKCVPFMKDRLNCSVCAGILM